MLDHNILDGKIKDNDRVLDFGSGYDPHPRADVWLDAYEDNIYRGDGLNLIKSPKLVMIKDGDRLPFKDKEFDFVIASHTFQYLSNPELYCSEIIRIGRAGYVEAPTREADAIFGMPTNKWHVYLWKDRIVFEPYKHPSMGDFFHRLYREHDGFRTAYEVNKHKFVLSYFWNGSFKYEVRQ